ncbi:hypothetical protein PI126_g12052 [Phytophthora idaei]|nr:hypothetical protein PI126_g12052 [Phytophthora idaei]
MSPNGSDDTSQRPNPHDVQDTDVHELNVAADPVELFEGTHSDSGASDTPGRGSRNSSASSERLDRLEGHLEGMAKQQAQFVANQAELHKQLQHRTEPSNTSSFEYKYGESSAFTDFIKVRARRMRVGSLDTSMRTATPATPAPEMATPQTETTTNMQQPMNEPVAEQFVPPPNFGLKVPKPRDQDWPGFAKFTGKEAPADERWKLIGGIPILALNGKLDGTALVYFERVLPLWTTESPTLEHVMNQMLTPYMTTILASKGLQLMTAEKLRDRTWAEHFQYLTYVAERSGCPDLHVLQCLCESAPVYLQSAMLTRLNSQRVDYIQEVTELVAFTIEFEASMTKHDNLRGNRGHGSRFHNGGRGVQGGRGFESV